MFFKTNRNSTILFLINHDLCICVGSHPRKLPVKFNWNWPSTFRDDVL